MPESRPPEFGINSWLEDELYQQYLHDRKTVDDSWTKVFESSKGGAVPSGNGTPVHSTIPNGTPAPAVPAAPEASADQELIPLRGAAARIAENMNASLSVPLATSQRVIPVKVIDENRRIVNEHRALTGKSKISYTHIVGWAIVKAVQSNPTLNHAYAEINGEPFRVLHNQINIGIAVDVAAKDGTRSLKVPNIRNAGALDFAQYVEAFDDIVARARSNKLTVQDFEGTTISLTNQIGRAHV